jgi:hypothetical protein
MRSTLVACLVSLLLGLIAGGQAVPQSPATPAVANAWMKNPTPYLARFLSAPGATRQARDQFWDNTPLAARIALTPETAPLTAVSEGSWGPNSPEIPEVPDRVILTATFATYQSILTRSGRVVYTEISFGVQRAWQDHGRALANSTITLAIPGGTVAIASGQNISFLTQPRKRSLQPNKSYLMVLSYHASGDFYSDAGNWDISDGTVRANNLHEEERFKECRSTLVGLTVEQLIHMLNEHFSKDDGDR